MNDKRKKLTNQDRFFLGRFSLGQFFILSIFAIMLFPAGVQADDASITARLAGHSMLLDGVSRDGSMTVVGERGHVLISTDGEHWQQIIVPTRATITGVYFHDKQNGWVVGHDAVILRTTDGGKTWEKVYYDPEGQTPLFDIWFRDEKHGIAIGAYGLYLVSEDGGASWDVSEMNVSVPEPESGSDDEKAKAEDDDDFLDSYDLHLNSIAVANNGKLYIAAEAGKAYRSDDSGDSWVPLAPDYIGSFFGVLPVTGDTVLVFGLRGHMFRSEDAGENWQEIETPTQEMLTNGIVVSEDEIYITGLGGIILRSNDGGKSFSLVEQGHRDGFNAIIQGPEGKLITVGEKGVHLLQ
jgi:photosystem II stability/assembly factor-like uncharacterized protein